jgi:hypothetical protein
MDLPADPSPRALGESLAALAVQLADLRGQIRALNERLDQAGLHADLNLAARFEELAQTVADALDTAAPRGPAAPYWIDLDRDTYHAQLADLRRWADTVLRQHYGGYELRECWPRHIHAIWEVSTLAAEWHRTYGGTRPDLARAWSSTTDGCPAPCAASPTSLATACRSARCSAAPVTGLLVPGTAKTCARKRRSNLERCSGESRTRAGNHGRFSGSPPKPPPCLPKHHGRSHCTNGQGRRAQGVRAGPVAEKASAAIKRWDTRKAGSSANERLTWSANLRHANGGNRSTVPARSCESRTMTRPPTPTSTQLPPPFPL